jgi:hypothetical protein
MLGWPRRVRVPELRLLSSHADYDAVVGLLQAFGGALSDERGRVLLG